MNCQFCFTGRMGLLGNLTTAQIVEQVRATECTLLLMTMALLCMC
jgi:adenine C2-methylase RlmN of 23S rRNA A2503 and tRNA A37